MAEAVHKALDDAGLSVRDVDGLFAVTPYYWMPSVTLADQLGIQPKVTDSTNIGGASVIAHVGHAVRAIVSGQCEVAVIAYASTQRTDAGKLVTGADILPYERPYGALFPISGYAMVTQRHMHEYGTTREQLAKVAVAASQWASLNPEALKPEPLAVADVLASPLVSDPLRKLDICLVTDGGGAIVLTTARPREEIRQTRRQRARHRRKPQPLLCDQHAELHRDGRRAVRPRRVRDGGARAAGHRRRPDLRCVHDHGRARSRGPRVLQEGRGGRDRRCRHRARLQPTRQHDGRRVALLPSGDVRDLSAGGGGAPAAQRMRQAPGRGTRARRSRMDSAASSPATRRSSSGATAERGPGASR